MGSAIKRVHRYKILGLNVSDNLTWNTHIAHLFKKANKRLYALRILEKSGLPVGDLVKIFYALIRSVLEYASPVWAALPDTFTTSSSQYKEKLCALCSLIWVLRLGPSPNLVTIFLAAQGGSILQISFAITAPRTHEIGCSGTSFNMMIIVSVQDVAGRWPLN